MAKENKKGTTIFYHDWLDTMEDLSDEEFGKLARALLMYDRDGEVPEFHDRSMNVAFKQVKVPTDKNRERYQKRCETNRRNQKVRWNTNIYERIPSYTNDTNDTDNDNDNDNDLKKEIYADAYMEKESADAAATDPVDELTPEMKELIVKTWNDVEITNGITAIAPLSKREADTRLCIGHDLSAFLDAIEGLMGQKWLVARFRDEGIAVTYDWFINPDNYQKVLEGNYKTLRRPRAKPKTAFQDFPQREYDWEDIEDRLVNVGVRQTQ